MPTPDPIAILRDLIRCASVTPADAGALDAVAQLLEPAGFHVERLTFSGSGAPDTPNLFARYGHAAPLLVFAGHTDVVPPGDAALWRFDPFSAEVADGMVWGRGAADMKGGVAAALAAALRFVEDNPHFPGSLGFLITGDEEGPAVNGTVKVLDWLDRQGVRIDHCVLGEPTNPTVLGEMVKIGRRGSLSGTLVVEGRQGHVAYPHLADNPIPRLVAVLAALASKPLDAGTRHFDPSNLEITTVDVGNGATNVIPAAARARFNIRFNDVWTPDALAHEIESRCRAVGGAAPFSLAFDPCNAVAFVTEPSPFVDLVRRAITAETGRLPTLSTTGGTSDARFIKRQCPIVEFGLVGETIHAVNERVAVADVETLTRIFGRIFADYFAAAPA